MKGQTLIEVLVVLGAATIIITALTTVIVGSLNNSTVSKNENLATDYATQAQEIVRQIRDDNYATFKNTYANHTYCLGEGQTTLSTLGPCTTPNIPLVNGIFIRSVTLSNGASDCGDSSLELVTVKVAWNDSKCTGTAYCHYSQLSSCLNMVASVVGP